MQPLLLATLASVATAFPILPILNLFMKTPSKDSFYQAPSGLENYANGQIIDSRRVDPDLELKLSLSQVNQISYRTEDVYGNPSHTVATIFKPLKLSDEPKLFSYQFWEDSVQLDCSPSYTLVKGVLSPDWVTGVFDTEAAIEFALLHGYYVVVPDHEGPDSAFIEGYTQGHAGLDGIRAAIDFLNLAEDTPTVLYGYSGGASATVWMANLHESYAPELNIVGAAHGGTPLDIASIVNWLDRTDRQFSGFILGAFTGLMNAYHEHNETIWPHLTEEFQQDMMSMKDPKHCILTEILLYGHQVYHTKMDVDFWSFEPVLDIMNRESLLMSVGTSNISVPKFPRYIFHAQGDQIIPFAPVEQYVKEQCNAGANIQWVPWRGDDHLSVEYLGIPDAFQFIRQAFEGTTPQLECGTASDDLLTLASTTVGDIIGQGVADMLELFNGLVTPMGQISYDAHNGVAQKSS